MKRKTLAFVFLILSFMMFGQEINSSRFETIVKALKINRSQIRTEFYAEKKMPNEKDSYIVVLPILDGQEDEGMYTVRNYILITDEKGNIKNKYYDPEEITSDAVGLSGITIDTGLYTVSKDIRAFGIRVSFRGQSKPNPYSTEELSLFYRENGSLKKILNRFEVYSYGGEWDTRCNGAFHEITSTIDLDKKTTANFTDLIIKTQNINRRTKLIKGDCKDFETSKTTYKTLKFSNGKYQ